MERDRVDGHSHVERTAGTLWIRRRFWVKYALIPLYNLHNCLG